jgi:hypothetical protein
VELNQYVLLPRPDFGFLEEELFFRFTFVDFEGEDVLKAHKNASEVNESFIKENCARIYKGVKQMVSFTSDLMR